MLDGGSPVDVFDAADCSNARSYGLHLYFLVSSAFALEPVLLPRFSRFRRLSQKSSYGIKTLLRYTDNPGNRFSIRIRFTFYHSLPEYM
jgi:hypothetical protein